MQTELVKACPVCKGTKFTTVLTCKDHTYSQQFFTIQECNTCRLYMTNPRPDENSIGDFYNSEEYISHTGKSRSLFDALYMWTRSFTLKWKKKLILSRKSSGVLLDYGCGTGEFLSCVARDNWEVKGIEPASKPRKKANTITAKNGEVIVFESLKDLPEQKFDIITLWHVLEHVPDPNQLLHALKQLLTNDGLIFVAVPNHESFDTKLYRESWAGYDVPRHFWHFTKGNMNSLLINNELSIKEIIPMKLDAYYVSLLSEKYKNNGRHTLLTPVKALITGMRSNAHARKNNNYSSLIYIAAHA